ncbi:MAG: PBP1A family penicillin-binding protein, partial [Deltaproteobacteria bacterium]|nr:PBP1A family penicillin-binding protein [Deltaproteobacteria bacterium]
FWKEARLITPIDKIPKKLIQAFVASEDDRFFDHGGIDFYGIARAFLKNLQAGHTVQGGSTITQQLVKSILLSPEQTYDRKIKEAILATRLENNFSKEEILYIYLNQIYFGNRSYGIGVAAQHYFHKNLDQLNLAEMAIIAGLPKSPSKYDPTRNPQNAKNRVSYVLKQMVEEEFITPQEAEAAQKLPLQAYKAPTDKEFNMRYAPYFVEEVRRQLVEKYGSEALYTKGWKIYTTLNLPMYQAAQKAVLRGVDKFVEKEDYRGPLKQLNTEKEQKDFLHHQQIVLLKEKKDPNYYDDPKLENFLKQSTPIEEDHIYQALVIQYQADKSLKIKIANREGEIKEKDWSWTKKNHYRPQSGDIIEVKLKETEEGGKLFFSLYQSPTVQSALYAMEPVSGAVKAMAGGTSYEKSEFNRATQARLQPGSTIKPLIYAAALDKGYTPKTTILDAPLFYETGRGRYWKPQNAGGKHYGPTAFADALRFSRNVPTVKILLDIGTHFATAYMRKLGLTSPINKVPAMALGSNEVYLNEMVHAYAVFATGGRRVYPHLVNKIVSPNGSLVEEFQANPAPWIFQYGDPKVVLLDKPKEFKDWQDMDYQPELWEKAQETIKNDELNLNEYEQKMLYGAYIPEGYVMSPKTAATLVPILQSVISSGTGWRAKELNRPAAGKTGTTNKATDVWFMGFTPNLVAGAWVGHDQEKRSLGRGIEGGNTGLPVWLDFMKVAVQFYEEKDFIMAQNVPLDSYSPPVGQLKEFDPDMLKGLDWGSTDDAPEFFLEDFQ